MNFAKQFLRNGLLEWKGAERIKGYVFVSDIEDLIEEVQNGEDKC